MGAVKRALFPYYEAIEQEFEEKHGRESTDKEREGFWDEATERMRSAIDARRKELKES